MRLANDQKDQGEARREEGPTALRCCCGSLLARLVPDGVELKCRRCKRQIIIPLEKSGFDMT